MADIKTSDLPEAAAIGSAGTHIGVQDGATVEFVQPMEYVAALTQSGGGAPTAVVLRNTLGATVSFVRDDAGVYRAVASSPVFNTGHTEAYLSNSNGQDVVYFARVNDTVEVALFSGTAPGAWADGTLTGLEILHITVYP